MSCSSFPAEQVPEKGVPLSPATLSVTSPDPPPLFSSSCAAYAGACHPQLVSGMTAESVATKTNALWISILVSPFQKIRLLLLPHPFGLRFKVLVTPFVQKTSKGR
jgi:hypothetical protein